MRTKINNVLSYLCSSLKDDFSRKFISKLDEDTYVKKNSYICDSKIYNNSVTTFKDNGSVLTFSDMVNDTN